MRLQLLTDPHGLWLCDPHTLSYVGVPGPWGNERVVAAIALNESQTGPVLLTPDGLIVDAKNAALGDPFTGALIGRGGIWIHRFAKANVVVDSRGL